MNKYLKYFDNIIHHDIGIDVSKPTFINLSLSNKCNSRCVMCDIWKHPSNDLYGTELFQALDSEYLDQIRTLGITGGEPFLRADLPEIIEYALGRFTHLKHIGITTNGFNTSRILKLLERFFANNPNVKLSICISIDGYGSTHNLMRKVKRAWDNVNNTIIALSPHSQNIILSIACTVTRLNSNYENLLKLQKFALNQNIPIIFRMAVKVDRIFNEELIDNVGLIPGSRESLEVSRFLKDNVLLNLNARTMYYHMMVDFLEGHTSKRTIKCKEMRDGAMLDSNGDIYVCSVSGKKFGNLLHDDEVKLKEQAKLSRAIVRENNCSSCFHDHLSHKSPLKLLESFYRLHV
ncbi:radical SAM protein [Psychrosphaera haliotis]|uniref:Radical SAM protein n=1 Tax=Psychrosphaera haliotis TaxID=555083 RepID=A0A6N8F8D8_9GAMM|nr:radical SAM protein [Psychrosphaera haliotis]MUH71347.1 radical SAM protein [Psychrosphaera haliotis]